MTKDQTPEKDEKHEDLELPEKVAEEVKGGSSVSDVGKKLKNK